MALLPLQLARVSNLLRTSVSQQQISRTQQSLLALQNQLSTGKRLNAPSDDPGDAAIAQQLRKTLEQRVAYADNLTRAVNHLSEADSTLGDLTDLLRQAQTIASANVGSDVTADQRAAAGAVVQSLYRQLLSLGNRQFESVYLFAGDRATAAPFEETLGGVKFVGSENVLQNRYDENTVLPFMVDGNEIFGALSTRVEGSADLTPALWTLTRLADLRGASGDGVRPGSILLGNGTSTAIVDLSGADSVQDAINAINAAAVGGITASVAPDGNSLLLWAAPGDNITVNEVAGGTTAADLGILQTSGAGAGVPLDGQALQPKLTLLTRLADLNGGGGLDLASGLVITNGIVTDTISFSGLTTVEDMLNAVNSSKVGVRARINAAGTGIDILNPVQGVSMTIAENGGTTAADLGVRSFTPDAALSDLNGGRGIGAADGEDLLVTRRDGTTFTVELSAAQTVQDVIDAINLADAGGGVAASFAVVGNGIVLTDTTGGTGTLSVASARLSHAAEGLGLNVAAAGGTLTGTDVHPVEARGIFANIARLRDGLIRSDSRMITQATEGLAQDLQRVTRVRGEAGARVQELQTRQQRLEDQNVATQALLSALEDTDFIQAVAQFESLQQTLQANLQTTGRLLEMSLFDFLG